VARASLERGGSDDAVHVNLWLPVRRGRHVSNEGRQLDLLVDVMVLVLLGLPIEVGERDPFARPDRGETGASETMPPGDIR
jgi:hypothetical protein